MSHHQFLTGFRGPAGAAGAEGPPGEPGPPGPAGGLREFTKRYTTASDSWLIEHMLGAYPVVTILDGSDQEIWADVAYLDANRVLITFAMPFTGVALLKA